MKIGFIGAGFVGRVVGKLAQAAGHEVMLSNSRDPRSLFSLSRSIGARIGSPAEAAAFGDIVVLALPFHAREAIPAAPLAGRIVLDAVNYYPDRDGATDELDRHLTTTSEIIARRLPGARLVKAFNSVIMTELEVDGRPAGAPDRRALPIAGDDADAKAVTGAFIDALGFDVVDAGPLAEGWRFERGMPIYCARLDRAALTAGLAASMRPAG